MATAFEAAGQQHTKPVHYAPIFTDRYFTGLWTNRNPLRDAATTFVLSKYGSFSRYESLIDGLNVELTTRLTIARRPGLSVYNTQTFGKILTFYSFKRTAIDTETIQVIVQDGTAGQVYNATGPGTKVIIAPADTSGFATAFLTLNNPNLGAVMAFQAQNNFGFPYASLLVYDGTHTYPWGVYASGVYDPFYAGAPILIIYTRSVGSLSPTTGYKWAYSYYNSATDDVSNVVGNSSTVFSGADTNKEFNLTGPSDESNPPITTFFADKIRLWRTLDGGSTYFFLADIPNPNTGLFPPHTAPQWTYTDNKTDDQLNQFIQAPNALENTSAVQYIYNVGAISVKARITASAFHLNSTWIAVGNVLYYSRPGSAISGNSTSSFPPLNNFTYPSDIKSLIPTSIGMLVITTSDIYIVQGNSLVPGVGTLVFSTPFLLGYGTTSVVAVCQDGATIYLITSDGQLYSLDPGSGVSEVGFPIGDQIPVGFPALTSYVTFLRNGSTDKALYLTSPVTGSGFRMSPTSAPETGLNWSPRAVWTGGCSAVQAVETAPGVHRLLFGPPASGGNIRTRSAGVFTDRNDGADVPYDASFTIGSIGLASPGQIAEVSFIAADILGAGNLGDSSLLVNIPTVSVLFNEIHQTYTPGSPPTPLIFFTPLPNPVPDPPTLPESVSVIGLRWYVSAALGIAPANAAPLPAWCRHMQVKFDWGASPTADEILTSTIYGAVWNMG